MVNKYEKDFYEYLKNNDYILKKYLNGLNYYNAIYIHKDCSEINKYSSAYSYDKFDRYSVKGDGDFSSENIKRKYIKSIWVDELSNNKEFIKELDFFIGSKSIISFISSLETKKEVKAKFLTSLPVSFLSIHDIDFTELTEFVKKLDFSEEKEDKFYLSFFKARKNQLKNRQAEKVEEFLINKYGLNEDKLEPYFSFFPNINNRFNEIDLDIIEEKRCLFSVIINARKAAKILYGKPEDTIVEWIGQFTSSYGRKNNISGYTENIDKSNCTIESSFYGSKTEFITDKCNREHFSVWLKKFLIYYAELGEKEKLNHDFISKWILQEELSDKFTGLVKMVKGAQNLGPSLSETLMNLEKQASVKEIIASLKAQEDTPVLAEA